MTTEILNPGSELKNERRAKAGKAPLFETKFMVLKATEPKNNAKSGKKSDRNSPRQHLRRGHIRRTGSVKIWVNSCLVGKRGFITKQYGVTL